jgi:hypothetical protein
MKLERPFVPLCNTVRTVVHMHCRLFIRYPHMGRRAATVAFAIYYLEGPVRRFHKHCMILDRADSSRLEFLTGVVQKTTMASLDRPEGLDHELPRAVLQRLIKSAVRARAPRSPHPHLTSLRPPPRQEGGRAHPTGTPAQCHSLSPTTSNGRLGSTLESACVCPRLDKVDRMRE